MLRERGRRAVREYNALIINRRLGHCRHPLLGNSILHRVFLPGLVNYPGRLCINCVWPALFSCRSRRNLHVINDASRQYWSHCRRCVDTRQSRVGVGVDLYAGLEFWTFFQPQSQGSTYMRIALYAGIYGTIITPHSVSLGQLVHTVLAPFPASFIKYVPGSLITSAKEAFVCLSINSFT